MVVQFCLQKVAHDNLEMLRHLVEQTLGPVKSRCHVEHLLADLIQEFILLHLLLVVSVDQVSDRRGHRARIVLFRLGLSLVSLLVGLELRLGHVHCRVKELKRVQIVVLGCLDATTR